MHNKQVFTTGEVADLLHIHQTTVIDWAKRGYVKSYKTPGGHRRIEREALIKFLHDKKMPIPTEIEAKSPDLLHNAPKERQRPRLILK